MYDAQEIFKKKEGQKKFVFPVENKDLTITITVIISQLIII